MDDFAAKINTNPRQFGVYSQLYEKETEHTDFVLEDESSFKYCLGRQFFVLIIAYTSDGHILLERTFCENGLKWSIPGGGIRPTDGEDFLHAANRVCMSYGQDLKLADLTPFAFLENTFEFNGEHVAHRGIGFIGRIRNNAEANKIKEILTDRGYLVPLDSLMPHDIFPRHNAAVYPLAKKAVLQRLENLVTDFDSEMETTENIASKFRIHNRFIKPAIARLSNSKLLLAATRLISKSEFDSKIVDILKADSSNSMIDVACGDSELCPKLAKEEQFKCVVANDVAFNQISMIDKAFSAGLNNLIFTNHDARNMPFRDGAFDVGFVKNVLHHISTKEGVRELLLECSRVAKKFVVVEIDDPQRSYWSSRKMNDYYVHWLDDDYVEFYDKEAFRGFFDKVPGDIEFQHIRTFQGAYNIAVVRSINGK
jgi:2-polyprenyl-3-methyl-5-hydroxy-6-metoxy-1,4-benzoquinol methylase